MAFQHISRRLKEFAKMCVRGGWRFPKDPPRCWSHIQQAQVQQRPPPWLEMAGYRVVNYPTRWSLYSSLDFCVDHLSWQWRPHIAGCKMFLTLLRAELAVLTHFFCKMYQWYMWGRQKPENEVFLSLFPPPKWPRKLTHDCFPKIRIDPYIWETPSNVLTTGWED